jgi:Winged helix DNA-binding domain
MPATLCGHDGPGAGWDASRRTRADAGVPAGQPATGRAAAGGSLPAAASACGIQDTPLNTAPLAFHARIEGLDPSAVGRALVADKSLLGVWSVRGAPSAVPSGDATVFTAGAMPADEASTL